MSQTQGVYELPNSPKNVGGLQWGAIVLGLLLLLLTNVAVTQYMAREFGYSEYLGQSLFTISGAKVYSPHVWSIWYMKFDQVNAPAHTRDILMNGLLIEIAGAAISVAAVAALMYGRSRNHHEAGRHLHGSARWAERKEIEEMGLLKPDGKGSGVYVGGWEDPKGKVHYLRHNGPEHILAFAPSRSGKGVGLVLPTLLAWPHACVVYDIKGENHALTAGWRAKHGGNRVLKFSPVEMEGGDHYNPLAEIRLGTPRDVSDAQNIATMITHPGGDTGEHDHWVDSATSLLVGVILYACYQARLEGRVASLPDVAQVLTRPGQSFTDTLIDMLGADLDPHHMDSEKGMGWILHGKPSPNHPVIAEKAQEMKDKEDKEMSGILSTAKVFMQLYSDPIVAGNIRNSDFTVDDLVNQEKPVTLYVVVPPSDKDRLRPLTRLIFTQIINKLTERMDFKDGRSVQTNKHRLLMLIDEFPTLGRMDILVNAMGYTAGYGIKYYLIVQDKVQLNAVYGQDELVFSGTHVRIAYAPNNPETADLLSRMTGTMTVQHLEHSYSGHRMSMAPGQVSTSVTTGERPLLTPDECGRLPGPQKDKDGNVTKAGDMLIFVTGFPPIYGKQILYFKDPAFSARAKIPAPPPRVREKLKLKPIAAKEDAVPAVTSADVASFPEAGPDVVGEDEQQVIVHRAEDVGGTAAIATTAAAVKRLAVPKPANHSWKTKPDEPQKAAPGAADLLPVVAQRVAPPTSQGHRS